MDQDPKDDPRIRPERGEDELSVRRANDPDDSRSIEAFGR
jgi:hypothetical protein